MLGYLKNDEANQGFLDEEGFARTGDICHYDEQGTVYYVDRMKELIKYKNNHVSPTELEDILQSHPAVQECLVFGLPEPSVQELFSAAVVLKPEFANVRLLTFTQGFHFSLGFVNRTMFATVTRRFSE